MSRVIAFFDFDGTVTRKDTLLEFIKYVKGESAFYFGFLLHAPVLVLYKLNVISNQRAKEIMLRYFFGKMDAGQFNSYCKSFAQEKLSALVRQKAVNEIQKLKEAGAEVVIVSASPENWLTNWCVDNGLQCVATKLVIKNNKITGDIDGFNCHGKEKVRRIQNEFSLNEYSAVYAYGDTPGDKHMLSLANYRFYKPFR